MPPKTIISARELRATTSLAALFGLRMFGMFIILPVFALYAETLPGGRDHTLVGVALGAYGLTQALLQVPFGWLSDRWGRKPAIYLGLVVFALGSLIAALSTDIAGVILGRVVQGGGAISAVIIALVADLTDEQNRTKAMATIGMTIGAAFALSMVGGPVLNRLVGVPGIFLITGALALAALGLTRFVVPDPEPASVPAARSAVPLAELLLDTGLMRLNLGIFVLHSVLMALWVVVPFSLRAAGLPPGSHWQVYLPVMVGSMVLMVPPMIWAERAGRLKQAFLGAIALLLAAELGLALCGQSLAGLTAGLLAFFVAFNLLEATLPSLLSRTAPAGSRGAAMGIYSTLQFLGTFLGASVGGAISERAGGVGVFAFCLCLSALWLALAWSMRIPRPTLARSYRIAALGREAAARLEQRILALDGVREAAVPAAVGIVHLKVDKVGFNETALLEALAGEPVVSPGAFARVALESGT